MNASMKQTISIVNLPLEMALTAASELRLMEMAEDWMLRASGANEIAVEEMV